MCVTSPSPASAASLTDNPMNHIRAFFRWTMPLNWLILAIHVILLVVTNRMLSHTGYWIVAITSLPFLAGLHGWAASRKL